MQPPRLSTNLTGRSMLCSSRAAPVLVLLALLSAGCSRTHSVRRTDGAALARLTERLAQRPVSVETGASREWGLVLQVGPDSTRYQVEGEVRTVSTASVRRFITGRRKTRPLTGLALGGAVAVATAAVGCQSLDVGSDCYATALPAGLVAGAVLFVGTSVVGGPRHTYLLVE